MNMSESVIGNNPIGLGSRAMKDLEEIYAGGGEFVWSDGEGGVESGIQVHAHPCDDEIKWQVKQEVGGVVETFWIGDSGVVVDESMQLLSQADLTLLAANVLLASI